MDYIDVGLEQRFNASLSGVDSDGDRPEDTGNENSVSWFGKID